MSRKHFYLHRSSLILGNLNSLTIEENPNNPDGLSLLRNAPVNVNCMTARSTKKFLMRAFQITREEQEKVKSEMSNPRVEYLVHLGRMFSTKSPGTHPFIPKKSLKYRHLTLGDLDMDELESSLQKIDNSISWYDLVIYTPEPSQTIRYKIFISNDKEKLRFITNEEAGVNGNGLKSMQRGPGYFVNSDMKIAVIDLVDPEHGITTRINTFIYDDSQPDEEALTGGNQLDEDVFNHHLESLAPFFNGIKILQNDDSTENQSYENSDITLPNHLIPQGYTLDFFRCVTRASYRFDEENILRTSKEKVFVSRNSPPDLIDLFFENEAINNLLANNDWQPSQVVDEMANLLKSSKTMLANYWT